MLYSVGSTLDDRTPFEYIKPDDPLMPRPLPVEYGWQCPSCGQVYSPHVVKCEYCVPRTVAGNTITIGRKRIATTTDVRVR
jgi:hypothetical protein